MLITEKHSAEVTPPIVAILVVAFLALISTNAVLAETICHWSSADPYNRYDNSCPTPCQEGQTCMVQTLKYGQTISVPFHCKCWEGSAPAASEQKTRKPPCPAAVSRFGLDPSGESSITYDYEDIKKQFDEAVKRYDNLHSSKKARIGETELGMAPLLSWMANQGGTVDFISKHFVFANDSDRAKWETQARRPQPEVDQVRKGTERQLYNEMYRMYQGHGKKLSPGDILYLALEQREGNMKEAMLLAHNTLRSLARENDGLFTDVHRDLDFFDTVIEPLIDPEPLGRGQNAGAVYHLFGTAAVELYAKSNLSLNTLATYSVDFLGDRMKDALQTLLRKIKKDPDLELPETRSALSYFANEFEQTARKMKWGSPDDPEKYCYNIVGAQIGAWLYKRMMNRELPAKVYAPVGTPQTVPTVVQMAMSPMDITWQGDGYEMTFHQETGDFTGFYPLRLFPFYEEESGTWGIIWSDLLGKPYEVTLKGTADGPAHIVSLNLSGASGESPYRVFHLPLERGQIYSYEVPPTTHPARVVDASTGAALSPADLLETAPGTDASSAEREPGDASPPSKKVLAGGVDNAEAVSNGPSVPALIESGRPFFLRSIRTYHWNGGRGKKPGTIALKDRDGNVYGPWQARGIEGQGGVSNAYWLVEPNVTLDEGKYMIVDSDPSTWATNEAAGNVGFYRIEIQWADE